MSDEKTSQLSEASLPLDGSEIVGIVQEGANVQTTTAAIANIPFDGESIAIGQHSEASGPFNVAIGLYSVASGFGVAIGQYTNLSGFGGVAIGYAARANYNATAVGSHANADLTTIAIGANAVAHEAHSVAIGVSAYALYASTAIGYSASCRGHYSIAIGMYASAATYDRAIAIGHQARATDDRAVAVGYQSEAAASAVSIGYKAGLYGSVEGGVAIGAMSTSALNSTAIGCYSHAFGAGAVALGAYSYANTNGTALGGASYANNGAVAIGDMSHAAGAYSVALGAGAITVHPGSTVFGFGFQDVMIGELVINGFPNFSGPFAIDRYQKLVAATSTVTTSAIMTSDGNPASSHNVPVIHVPAAATLSARVTGVNTTFATGGDMATFVLDSPVLVTRDNGGVFAFVNEPTFVLENSTDGASSWAVPILGLSGDSDAIFLTVNQSGDVNTNWMAHLKWEGTG